MTRITTVVCAAVGAVLIFAGAAHAAPAKPPAPAPIVVPFQAKSGDGCGHTEGNLGWFAGRGPIADPGAVAVNGIVVDQPVAGGGSQCLAPHAMLTRAAFTAYAGGELIDEAHQFADDGSVEFKFELADGIGLPGDAPPDRVVVQVCRISLVVAFESCGKPQEYLRPSVA